MRGGRSAEAEVFLILLFLGTVALQALPSDVNAVSPVGCSR